MVTKKQEAPEEIASGTAGLLGVISGGRMTRDEFQVVLNALKEPLAPGLIRQREGWRDRNGNVQTVDYIEWHTVTDVLDDAAPDWESSIRTVQEIGDFIYVIVALTIGGITREGMGTGSSRTEMGLKKAEHDALKRAGVKFGIGRDLYKKFDDEGEHLAGHQQEYNQASPRQQHSTAPAPQQGGGGGSYAQTPRNQQGGVSFPSDPVAKTLADMITTKQLGMIRAVAREAGVDADEECTAVMNCQVTELSRRAASALIDHLRDSQGNNSPMRRAS